MEDISMKNVKVYLDRLLVAQNGRPMTKTGHILDRKSMYLLTLTLFSPGANSNKKLVTVKSFKEIENNVEIDFKGTNITTNKPYSLDDRFAIIGKIDEEAEITATLQYAENESIGFSFLKNVFGKLFGNIDDLLGSLSVNGMLTLFKSKLIEHAKEIPKMLEEDGDKLIYEIGYGALPLFEDEEAGDMIKLAAAREIRRNLSYTTVEGVQRDNDILIIPQGDNGHLKLKIRIT